MKVDEKIKEQLQRIVALGQGVADWPGAKTDADLDRVNQMIGQWTASARSILVNVFGERNEYYQAFLAELKDKDSRHPHQRAHGVVLGAQADYVAGGIFKVRSLVEAEIFDDFLEQAEHLLANGYFQAAAVVAGCVLEDAMRKLCDKHGIPLPRNPKLDTMNAELMKKGAYNALMLKEVTAKSHLRNKAAHGEWAEFRKDDVDAMIPWVRRFLTDHGF